MSFEKVHFSILHELVKTFLLAMVRLIFKHGYKDYMTKIFLSLILTLVSLIFTSCSSDIDPDLLAKIEHRTSLTEDLYESYEDANETLFDIIQEQYYYEKKFTKTKNALRDTNNRIISRKNRIASMENPVQKEGEEPILPAPPELIAEQAERLTELEEERAELELKAAEYLENIRNLTASSLTLRKNRDALYDEYTNSRLELKSLNELTTPSSTDIE
jgi:hypothetical protein